MIKYLKDNFQLLKIHKGFLKYSKNTSWLFAEQILRMTVGLLVGIWMARYLGPSQFGLFSYVQALVGIFAIIATLGLDSILVRELVNNEKINNSLVGTALSLRLAASILVIILIIFALKFFSHEQHTNILVLIVASATIFQSFNILNAYFQSKVISKYSVYTNSISFLISSILKVLLIIYEAPLKAFAYVVLLDSILVSFGLLYFYIKSVSIDNFKKINYEKNLAISLLKDSWPVIISGLAIVIYMKLDQVMIKEMIGDSALGQYAVAVRLSELWYFIPMAITTSLFPAIINARKISIDLYTSRLRRLYSFMFWLGLIVAIAITLFAEPLVKLLYGIQYHQAANVLIIHIWAGVFVAIGVAANRWMLCENLQYIATIYTIFGAIMNIILNIILIPKYGMNGAAYSTIISYAASAYFMHAFHSKTRLNFINISKSVIPKF